MSNKVAYKKSRKVILKLLNDSFPTPVDIDIFYIEGETPPLIESSKITMMSCAHGITDIVLMIIQSRMSSIYTERH